MPNELALEKYQIRLSSKTSQTVEGEVCFKVFGIRKIKEGSDRIAIDHQPTGCRIGLVPTPRVARTVILELMQLGDWKFKRMTKHIRANLEPRVTAILVAAQSEVKHA